MSVTSVTSKSTKAMTDLVFQKHPNDMFTPWTWKSSPLARQSLRNGGFGILLKDPSTLDVGELSKFRKKYTEYVILMMKSANERGIPILNRPVEEYLDKSQITMYNKLAELMYEKGLFVRPRANGMNFSKDVEHFNMYVLPVLNNTVVFVNSGSEVWNVVADVLDVPEGKSVKVGFNELEKLHSHFMGQLEALAKLKGLDANELMRSIISGSISKDELVSYGLRDADAEALTTYGSLYREFAKKLAENLANKGISVVGVVEFNVSNKFSIIIQGGGRTEVSSEDSSGFTSISGVYYLKKSQTSKVYVLGGIGASYSLAGWGVSGYVAVGGAAKYGDYGVQWQVTGQASRAKGQPTVSQVSGSVEGVRYLNPEVSVGVYGSASWSYVPLMKSIYGAGVGVVLNFGNSKIKGGVTQEKVQGVGDFTTWGVSLEVHW